MADSADFSAQGPVVVRWFGHVSQNQTVAINCAVRDNLAINASRESSTALVIVKHP